MRLVLGTRQNLTVSQVHFRLKRCWRGTREQAVTASQFHRFTGSQPIEAVLAENQGEGTREKGVGSKVQRLLLLAASPGIQAERSGATLIVSNIQGRRLRSGESGIPPGGRGEGVPILPLILNIPGWLGLRKTVLYRTYAHICGSRIRPAVTASQFHSPKHVFCWLAARECEQRSCAEGLRLSLFPLSAFERIRLQVRWKRITHGMRELKIIFGWPS
jgi:hypothetical protein